MDELEDLERTIKAGPIHEEIPSQQNKNVDLTSHFAQLHTRLDSMDAQMMSYGEQIGVLG